MLLLQTLPLNKELRGIPVDPRSDALQMDISRDSADCGAGHGGSPSPVTEQEPQPDSPPVTSDLNLSGRPALESPPQSADGCRPAAEESDGAELTTTADRPPTVPGAGNVSPAPAPSSSTATATSTSTSTSTAPAPAPAPSTALSVPDDSGTSAPSEQPPSNHLVMTALKSLQVEPGTTPTGSQWSCMTLSDSSSACGHGSDESSASSAAPCQSSQSSEIPEYTSERSGPSEDACEEADAPAETSRQRYDKLFRYFQALNSADNCPLATSQRSSDVTDSDVSAFSATGSSVSSARSVGSGGAKNSVSTAESVSYASSVGSVGSGGSDGFVGSTRSVGPARPMGYAGFVGSARSVRSADCTGVRVSSPTRLEQRGAPRPIRGGTRTRRVPADGTAGLVMGRTSGPAPARPGRPSAPSSRRQPAAGLASRSTGPAAVSGRMWGVPSGDEKPSSPGLRPVEPAAPLSPAAAWHEEFDELMQLCRGDRPLSVQAPRLRHRQPAPSRETLRQLRERVCMGCSRAFPESNYFDIYYHVNTVFRWFNWKLDA